MNKCFMVSVMLMMVTCNQISATPYSLPVENSRLIGAMQKHKVLKGDYFQKIAEQYNVGFLALMSANPGVDPFLPELDSEILIPSAMLLPYIKHEGIVINLPELRLYYFVPEENTVHVFPVGIGKEGLATPKVTSYISDKRKDPVWRPTQAMRDRYFAEHGKEMATEFAPGPENPFGKYALRLGKSEYLIHGTNKRLGIGMRASSGCIRMFDEDIKWMYDHVPINTKVRIIEQPIKMSYEANEKQLIEIHAPLSIDSTPQRVQITEAVKRFIGDNQAFWQQLVPVFERPHGLVVELQK
ncbi:MAG: L,D-transpeptidase family protein [Colwellia sp.]|nr:L,D-transpeptidase family protein [Colwellia sp.]MCW8865252.1 L,D-transpeptidase family protein [Colwellia sp.]MCW9082098.1 L,D-transpeptidase family protein [Colwellia sp.]